MIALSLPRSEQVLTEMLRVPLNSDKFFLETHMKLRLVTPPNNGVFLCGLVHAPNSINESITQASVAAASVSTILSKDQIQSETTVPPVDEEVYKDCDQCVSICAYTAIELYAVRKIAMVN